MSCSGWRLRVGVGVWGVFGFLGVGVPLEFCGPQMDGGADTANVQVGMFDFGLFLVLGFMTFKFFELEDFFEVEDFFETKDFLERAEFLDTSRFDI